MELLKFISFPIPFSITLPSNIFLLYSIEIIIKGACALEWNWSESLNIEKKKKKKNEEKSARLKTQEGGLGKIKTKKKIEIIQKKVRAN